MKIENRRLLLQEHQINVDLFLKKKNLISVSSILQINTSSSFPVVYIFPYTSFSFLLNSFNLTEYNYVILFFNKYLEKYMQSIKIQL